MRFFVPALCTAIATASAASLLHADPVPAALTAPQAVLSQGTKIPLRLETGLRSGRDKAGEPVLFTVNQNIYGPGHRLLLAKGSPARGHVTESAEAGSFGHAGELIFSCDYALAGGGVRVPLKMVVTLGGSESADAYGAQEHVFDPGQISGQDPDDYVQSAAPGGYYSQRNGSSASVVFDPGRFFGGKDTTADQGQKYTARVAADTVLAN